MPIGFVGPALQGARLIGGASQLGRYALGLGSLLGAGLTGSTAQRSSRVGSIPPSANGESYRRAELRLADAARAGGGGGGGGNAGYSVPFAASSLAASSDPATRAYEAEKSRVAQLTAQDPDLQRYEVARAAAKSQEEMNAVRDEGMRIWAQKHGGLAAKVKPGATGYEAIQAATGPVMPSALSNEQVQGVMSFDPNTVLSTTQNIQGQFRPNQQLTDQEILAAMSFDPNAALRSATNMAYAPMSPVEAAMLKEVGGAQGEYITPMNAVGSADQANLSFITPAEKRRQESSALFQELLNRANAKAR
jgi:hypothetical protein